MLGTYKTGNIEMFVNEDLEPDYGVVADYLGIDLKGKTIDDLSEAEFNEIFGSELVCYGFEIYDRENNKSYGKWSIPSEELLVQELAEVLSEKFTLSTMDKLFADDLKYFKYQIMSAFNTDFRKLGYAPRIDYNKERFELYKNSEIVWHTDCEKISLWATFGSIKALLKQVEKEVA